MKLWNRVGILLVAGMMLLSGCTSADTGSQSAGEDKSSQQETSVAPSESPSSQEESTASESSSSQEESPASEEPSQSSEEPSQSGTEEQPVSGPVEASFYDDAVFIGDSVSLRLYYYCQSHPEALGKAQFLTAGNMGSGNALQEVNDESVHPSYQGTKMSLEDGVKACGAKKVFIMLGMNDLNIYKIDGTVENMDTLAQRILKKSPDAEIYLQSMTPILAGHEKGQLTNENLDRYNAKLQELAKEKGYHFADVASVMKEADGSLKPAYCSDPEGMGMHFTDAGAEAWIDYLLQNAASF